MVTGHEIRRAAASCRGHRGPGRAAQQPRRGGAGVDLEEEEPAQVIELRESADDAPVVKLVHTDRSPTPCSAAPPTSTSSPARATCGFASASTAWCPTPPRCRDSSWPASCPGSRSWPTSTSPSAGRRRTGASASPWTAAGWTPRGHPAGRARRVRGHADPRRGPDRSAPSTSSAWAPTSAPASRRALGQHPRRRSSRPARRARARPPPSTRRSTELNSPEKTIITIEDPVEYELEGIKQVQVNDKIAPHLRRPACAR